MKRLPDTYLIGGCLLALGAGPAVTWAQQASNVIVIAGRQKPQDGRVTYSYRVVNNSSQRITGLAIGSDSVHGVPELSVLPSGWTFESGAPAGALASPAHWSATVIATEESPLIEIEWRNDGTADLLPGQTAAGFSVTVPSSSTLYLVSHWTVFFGDSTAASGLLVQEGNPRISIGVSSATRLDSGRISVVLNLKSAGVGAARGLSIGRFVVRTLSGSGTATVVSPSVPIAVGDLRTGEESAVTLVLNVPASINKLSIAEQGAVQDVNGRRLTFSQSQVLYP
jgi:hypothetical protein